MPPSEIAGSYGDSIFKLFKETAKQISKVTAPCACLQSDMSFRYSSCSPTPGL